VATVADVTHLHCTERFAEEQPSVRSETQTVRQCKMRVVQIE
jgi:hypothetical protein